MIDIDVLAPLLLLAMLAGVVAFVLAARRQRRQRAQLFRDLAESRGWRYLETDDGTAQRLAEGFAGFAVFHSPSLGDKPPRNVVIGSTDEGRVCLFLHATRKTEGDTRQWTVCLVRAGRELGPPLTVRPRSVKRARQVGIAPEVSLDDPRFDRHFEVRADAAQAARASLGPDVRELLVRSAGDLPFPVEIQIRGHRLAAYAAGRNDGAESSDDLGALVDFARRTTAAVLASHR